jgi:hypothetical protein
MSMLRLRSGSLLLSLSPPTSGWTGLPGMATTVAGEFMAADPAQCAPGMPQIADVICADECRDRPGEWASWALRRWPGAMVAAAHGDGRACVAGVRGQPPLVFRVRGCEDLAASPALLCASFAYGWLTAGCPVTVPENSCLAVEADTAGRPAVWSGIPGTGTRLSFRMSYSDAGLVSPSSPRAAS